MLSQSLRRLRCCLSLYEACGLHVWPSAEWKEDARNVSFNNIVDSKEVECFDPGRLSLPESWLSPARRQNSTEGG